MLDIIVAILILISSAASIYNAFGGVVRPEAWAIYNKARMPRLGIQLLSVFLGIGGILLLFPLTFKIGAAFLIIHSLITLVCFIIVRDGRRGTIEFLLLLIPIFILWSGYPVSVLEKIRSLFI
jgi:hypothetical protein